MKLISQKNHLKIYLKNKYFDKDGLPLIFRNIIDQSYITVDQKQHFNKNGVLTTWAFDFRIALLNSDLTKVLFPYISQYLTELGYDTIGLKGIGAIPFISLSQYSNIKNVFIVRDEKKINGFRNEIEGMNPNRVYTKPICIIDDLINSGGSLQKAYDVFASNNIEVNKYLSLINFGWGDKKINADLIDPILEVYK